MVSTHVLHADFGVEVVHCDLREVTRNSFPKLRALFEEHSLAVSKPGPRRGYASQGGGDVRAAGGPARRGNGHADRASDGLEQVRDPAHWWRMSRCGFWTSRRTSSGMPTARSCPRPPSPTFSWGMSSPPPRAAPPSLLDPSGLGAGPPAFKERVRNAVFIHRFSHSRGLVDPRLGELPQYTVLPDTRWRAIWTNPVNGRKSLLFGAPISAASRACRRPRVPR